MNICLEIIKNYEQLWSTISKFQALFSKIRALFKNFLPCFEHFLAGFLAQSQHSYPQQGYLSGYFRSLLSN